MDMLPIQPKSNLIKPTLSTANDGGSKSQSGYINTRTGEPEVDEVKISDETKRLIGEDPVIEEKNYAEIIKEFFLKIFRFILKIFNFKLPEKKQAIKKVETTTEIETTTPHQEVEITENHEKIEENEKSPEKTETHSFLQYTKHIDQ